MTPDEIVLGPLPFLTLGSIKLPTYHLFISFVLLGLVYYVNQRSYKKQFSGTTAIDLFLSALAGGVFGARLFHIFFEEPAHYLQHPFEVFYIWQGGFVFYGGNRNNNDGA